MACKALMSINGKVDASVEGSTNFLDDFSDDSFSHGFTVTWSYTTSGEAELAGKESDMFLGKLGCATKKLSFSVYDC